MIFWVSVITTSVVIGLLVRNLFIFGLEQDDPMTVFVFPLLITVFGGFVAPTMMATINGVWSEGVTFANSLWASYLGAPLVACSIQVVLRFCSRTN